MLQFKCQRYVSGRNGAAGLVVRSETIYFEPPRRQTKVQFSFKEKL